MNKYKEIIEGDFYKENAAKYLKKSGFDASPSDFDRCEKEPVYFNRYNNSEAEAWAGIINRNKIEIEILKYE